MTILEPGNPNCAQTKMTGRCQECLCRIECERSEATWQDLGHGDGCYFVECPCCKDRHLILGWA